MITHHLERNDTIRCFHCGNIVPMKLIGRDVSTWDEGDDYVGVEEWSFYMCPTCKEPTLVCWYWQQKGKKSLLILVEASHFRIICSIADVYLKRSEKHLWPQQLLIDRSSSFANCMATCS